MTSRQGAGRVRRTSFAMLCHAAPEPPRGLSSPSANSSCSDGLGYVQIEKYTSVKKRLKFVDPSYRRWVSLPEDTEVVSYPRLQNIAEEATQKSTEWPLRSCLKHIHHVCEGDEDAPPTPRSTASGCSDSTRASSSDSRRVHFSDGCLPGVEGNASSDSLPSSIAEWIYIDRNICGFSLYEYAPQVPAFSDFASSQLALEFLIEMDKLVRLNLSQHAECMADENYRTRYLSEEKELDNALKLSGVKPEMLA